MEGSTSSYTTMVMRGEQPQPQMLANPIRDGEDNEDSDLGPTAGPKVLSSIKLAMTPGVSYILVFLIVSYFLGVAHGYPHDVEGLAQHINQP